MDEEQNENEEIFAEVPEDLSALSDEELSGLVDDYETQVAEVTGNPASFVTADLTAADLIEATGEAIATLRKLKAESASRSALSPEDEAAFAELASESTEPTPEPELAAEPTPDPEPEAAAEVEETTTAAALVPASGRRLPRPPAGHEMVEHEPGVPSAVGFTAAGGVTNMTPGERFDSEMDIAYAIIERHETFAGGRDDGVGQRNAGAVEKFKIARADWRDEYPSERRLSNQDIEGNWSVIKEAVSPSAIKRALRDRIHDQDKTLTASGEEDNLVASGGLCAPVTPYYNLAYISVPVRPVMGSLPSFAADRGGLRYARPASLSAVSTAVGLITEAEDKLGGTSAAKSCQTIPCPPFEETDVDIIYHCLQFGNLGARAFPELVAQWNNLVLAAHARLAESNLLTIIDAASTQLQAGSMTLGASATLFSQILAAANGLRSRNRMDPEAVLRLMIPWWAVDLIVSDVIRTQFQRFDTDRARVTALLRSFNIEPTFYIDGANGRNQVFGTQGDGTLLPFPDAVVWYLFPEGSFLYLDAGMLELGIVRDSVLNAENNFQLFGETFESVAFVGVESLAVESWVCDSGTVSLPAIVDCPITNGGSFD